jgi:hypothetical protein
MYVSTFARELVPVCSRILRSSLDAQGQAALGIVQPCQPGINSHRGSRYHFAQMEARALFQIYYNLELRAECIVYL